MAGQKGNYSNIIIYDERRRYYFLHPQRNRPLLDDEIRDMGIGLLDQARRSVQRIYGDVAAPLNQYASSAVSTESAFKVVQATAPANNFTVTGGTAGGDSLDHPSVLYAKGFYIFFTGDVDYKSQRYSSSSTDLDTVSDKYKTLTAIPSLTTPTTDRIDIVYMHLHFEEVTSVSGSDLDVYLDTGLDNPIIGRDTANRLRAVFDIRVYEGWDTTTYPISEDIFNNAEFLGGISPNDSNPIENEYKIPIAVIYRHANQDNINTADIVDLLTLYNKRVPSLEEVGYRLRHGGYTQADVNELGYTGFQAQFPSAVVDEGAFATGLNQGIDTEALNTDVVTPRVLDNDGKFFMDALMVGHETGLVPFETGPEALHTGEVVARDQSLRSLYVGYEKGYTGTIGATGAREYRDNVSIYAKGESGTAGLSMTMMEGDTGSLMEYKEARTGHTIDNYQTTDYRGRLGINTMQPGWDGPDSKWGTSGINIVVDVNDSARVKKDLFVGDDAHFDGGVEGNTFSIPAQITDLNPAIFGNDEVSGATGAISAVLVKRGIGVLGVTGVSQAGYTGVAGYECYDYNGQRLFTIGDLGPEFDRTVMSLYGVGYRESFTTDYSLLDLPAGLGAIQSGDVVAYDIERENGAHVTGSLTTTTNGLDAVEEVRDDIIYNSG
ncbi:MAG: hypothetical protein GF334_11430, partial [Candidatus Altiarchaeales archaeon]|nr:hypothetical protein [Candidatus Altiarchaeales archaeon]